MKYGKIFLVQIILIAFLAYLTPTIPLGMKVVFFDISQGDAILVSTVGGYRILIDGGPHNGIVGGLGRELSFFDRKIDILILTHPHFDHLKGFFEVLNRYEIGAVMMTGVQYESKLYQRFIALIGEGNIPVINALSTSDIIFPDGTVLDVLWPEKPLAGLSVDDINASSIILRVTGTGKHILFAGDTTIQEELGLLHTPQDISASVLKIAHHGSKTSSSPEFLQEAKPQVAIISAGKKNHFGHPHREIINRLNRYGIDIRRTDENGDITLRIESGNLRYY